MRDAGHTGRLGSPFDNESVAARLGGETFTVAVGDFELEGFRAYAEGGTSDSPVAVLVHGWPQFAACWEDVAHALLEAGIDVVAYDQRGYSPGEQPTEVEAYRVAHLMEDLLAVTRALGIPRFHLVGHDWGGIMGWSFTASHPEELATFTSVSSAHPIAHGKRIEEDPEQYRRMHYLRRIRSAPEAVEQKLLAHDGARLADQYEGAIARDRVRSYLDRFAAPRVMEAALMYYRALGVGEAPPTQPITVPTLYVWGSEDTAFTRGAAELTGEFIEGEYRFVELAGASHWLPEQMPAAVAEAVIEWVKKHP